mgnify:CR=1 FL=1
MKDFQSLRPGEFERLSSAEQRHYLRTVAEHLAEMTRIYADMAHPRAVGREKQLRDDSS